MNKDSENGFLQRWSRRKQSEGQSGSVDQEATPAPETPLLTPEEEEARRLELEEYVNNLPDPDTLDYEADYTPFLKDGVPEELKGRALQRLWRSHPTLANLDGLIEYGEDYTDAAMVGKAIRTIYKVGIGMISDEDLALENLAKQRKAEAEMATEDPASQEEGQGETEQQPMDSGDEESASAKDLTAAEVDGGVPEDAGPATKEPKTEPPASQVGEPMSVPDQSPKAEIKPEKQPGTAHSRRWGLG